MNIKIVRLELINFKCFKHKEISFDSDVTVIRGRNGVGKTTIADAILWCLFGKNSQGQADFDLKTHDTNGKAIPNLDHSVEMELLIEADNLPLNKNVTLKRTLKETWVKKRGSDERVFKNNTTEYLVNGDTYTAADYKKYIAQLIGEEIFKAITSPTYFPSLKWQQQREFLTAMVGNISPEEVCGSDNELVKVFGALAEEGTDVIAYRKHLSYQIKGIKYKLEKIPVRLEEQNKALPELLDWDKITKDMSEKQIEYTNLENQIASIKAGNGADVKKESLRNEIETIQRELDYLEAEARKTVKGLQDDHDHAINEARNKFNSLLNTQRDIETQLSSFDSLMKRCKETLDQCEKDAQAIREEWAHNLSRKFHFHEADGVCPTCGQYLPEEQVAEKRNKAEENLNADKARIKTELTQKAEKVKATRADAEKELKDLETNKAEAEKNLADIKEQINTAFADKQKIEAMRPVSIDNLLHQDENYVKYCKQIDELRQQLDNFTTNADDAHAIEELEAKRKECGEALTVMRDQLSTRTQYDKIIALIDGINEEQKDLVRQLSELEKKEDVARRYQNRQNTILESRINEHFSLVKWKMFRTVNNGGDPFDEPFCECYVDGVAYHDGLNQAARLNAGLDIINTLCKHYKVSAPIVLDNSESTINILQTIGQQIRLQVADTDFNIV